jgi:tetratricopeptide (TPR) repeat protein
VQQGVRNSGAAHNYALDLYRAGKIRQAVAWFEKARALNDGSAMIWLAKIEIERKGAKGRDKAMRLLKQVLALKLYSGASEGEHEDAAALLAQLLEKD